MYDKNTVYIIGHGKTSNDNAITQHFGMFFIGYVVDTATDMVVDLSCASTIPTTQIFIKSLFFEKKFDQFYEEIEEEIKRRYFGSSQRAIVVAYKDAVKKYKEIKQKYY
ncbi:MAG: DUF3870 domain-containing protein [Marinisporobacter sp.]|jgi:hypothetical protein|nr:DUF3870 domain-containing protein [Marinisporobacter sp.]